jgi:hypothetical protein
MNADVRTRQLEALRTTCVAALTSCQAAVQHIEAIIADEDASTPEPAADDYSHLTFDDPPPTAAPAPTIRRRTNGKR